MYSIRKLVTALILLCLAVGVKAAPGGLAVQSWRWEPTRNAAVVRMLNTSDKDISAYSVSVLATFRDGTTNASQRSVEFLPAMAAAQIQKSPTNGTFEARGHEDLVIGSEKEIADVSVSVSAVIYSDMTANVKDVRAFEALIGARKDYAAATSQARDVMKKAGNSQEAIRELRRIAQAKGGGDQALILNGIAAGLTDAGLSEEITRSEFRANFYGNHAKLTAVQQ